MKLSRLIEILTRSYKTHGDKIALLAKGEKVYDIKLVETTLNYVIFYPDEKDK